MVSTIRGNDNFDSDTSFDGIPQFTYAMVNTQGTQSILQSSGVSSITDTGEGAVRQNFSNARANLYFWSAGNAGAATNNPYRYLGYYQYASTSYVTAVCLYDAQSNYDAPQHTVMTCQF